MTLLEKAMRLNPFYPDQYLWHLGSAYYNLHSYEGAIHAIEGMQNPTEGRRVLAASYAQLGRLNEARQHAQKVIEAAPQLQRRAVGERRPGQARRRCRTLRRRPPQGGAALNSV